ERGNASAYLGGLVRGILRRILIEDLVQIPDDRVRVEVGAVVELDALPQLDRPDCRIVLAYRPLRRQAGPAVGGLVGRREVPVDPGTADRVAGEPIASEAVVRLASRERDARSSHAGEQAWLGG